MSVEQKKQLILQFFQREYSFYNMKELEKLIPKHCPGVSSMLVKELVQAMIDEDGLISVEKCGNINIYWCFANQITQRLYDTGIKLEETLRQKTQAALELRQQVEDQLANHRSAEFSSGDPKTPTLYRRAQVLQELKDTDSLIRQLDMQYEKVSMTRWDQQKINDKRDALKSKLIKLDALTDNIEILISYLANTYSIPMNDLRRELEVPEEFEDIVIA